MLKGKSLTSFFNDGERDYMLLLRPAILLFGLNLLDAVLTVFWVRSGTATEGNQLMASLLDIGNTPFLLVKIAIGVVASVVLVRWGHRPVARFGLLIALSVYIGLMAVHILTGLVAFGVVSAGFMENVTSFPHELVQTFA